MTGKLTGHDHISPYHKFYGFMVNRSSLECESIKQIEKHADQFETDTE